MKKLIFVLFIFIGVLIYPVFAETQTFYVFNWEGTSSGYIDANQYVYVEIKQNSIGVINATVDVIKCTANFTIANITAIQINIEKILKDYNVDIYSVFPMVGKFTLIIETTETLEVDLFGIPKPKTIIKNGEPFINYTYNQTTKTLIFTLSNGDPEIQINFYTLIDALLPIIITFAMLSICFGLLRREIK